MALFNLFSWSKKMEEGTAAACGTACGAADKPEETSAACGTACGAADNRKKHLRHVAQPAERRTSSTGYNSDVRISYYLLEKPRQCCTPGCRNRAPAKIGRDRVGSKKGEG